LTRNVGGGILRSSIASRFGTLSASRTSACGFRSFVALEATSERPPDFPKKLDRVLERDHNRAIHIARLMTAEGPHPRN